MALKVGLRLTLGLAWKLFAPQTASKFEKGDIAEEKLRQLLLNEFQKLHEHLNALRRKELVASVAFLETGYGILSTDPKTAKDEFRKARDAAQMAFGVVPEPTDRILATKILVLSTMHEFDDNVETAKSLCLKYLSRMNSMPEVAKACQVTFGFKSKILGWTGKSARRDILNSVADINKCVWDFIHNKFPNFDEHWPRISVDQFHLHPIRDLILLRSPKTIIELDKELGAVVSAVCCKNFIFAALSQSTNSALQNDIIVIDIGSGKVRHLVGHSGVAFSLATDGKLVFSGSYDKSIMVWNSETLECVNAVNSAHEGAVRSLCASDNYLLSGSTDSTIKLWDLQTLEVKGTLNAEAPISYLTCSRRKFAFALTALWRAQIWDVNKQELLQQLTTSPGALKLIASDAQLYACGRELIEIFKLGSLQKDGEIKVHGQNAILTASNKFLVCGEKHFVMWDPVSRKCVFSDELEGDKTCHKIDLIWLHKGNLFACFSESFLNSSFSVSFSNSSSNSYIKCW